MSRAIHPAPDSAGVTLVTSALGALADARFLLVAALVTAAQATGVRVATKQIAEAAISARAVQRTDGDINVLSRLLETGGSAETPLLRRFPVTVFLDG
jgi:hypothetical protein